MNGQHLIRPGGTPIGYFDGENACMDAAFIGCDTGRRLGREGRAVRCQNCLAEKLRNLEQNVPSVRRVRVYQLKPDVDPARKFIGYQELKKLSGGPALKEYREVFCGFLLYTSAILSEYGKKKRSLNHHLAHSVPLCSHTVGWFYY